MPAPARANKALIDSVQANCVSIKGLKSAPVRVNKSYKKPFIEL